MTTWQSDPKAAAKARAAEPKKAEQPEAAEVLAEQAAAGSAIRPEDHVRAELGVFKRRLERSLETIRRAADIGAIGVSYSGGKDSTVCVALVRALVPNAPIGFFDSGAELRDTLRMVDSIGAQTIHPRLTMLEMAQYCGWWGYTDPVDADSEFDAKRMLIDEPSETFVVRNRLRVIVHGVRASESHARAMHTASRGELYRGRDGTWYCMPLARWELADVWAYIASRGLRYHPAYDRMSELGIPRENQRVSAALGERGSGWGRHATLRQIEPETWRRLVAEFPTLAVSS